MNFPQDKPQNVFDLLIHETHRTPVYETLRNSDETAFETE